MKVTALKERPRGRPRSIDRETVLAAAMKLAAAELNLPELAESLGTTVTTIYRLFGDKAGLHTAMYAEGLRQIKSIEGGTWSQWVDNYTRILLELTRRYPFLVTQNISLGDFNSQLRDLLEHSLGLMAPGIELMVKAGLERQSAYNTLAAIKAIVFEYARTERTRVQSTADLAHVANLRGHGDQPLWQVLGMFRNGIQAEMDLKKAPKAKR